MVFLAPVTVPGAMGAVSPFPKEDPMKLLILMLMGLVLLVACWPLAIVAVLLAPVVWLLAFPFLLVGLVVVALFLFLKALLFLPARLLGYRG
jgi:hypothetical protein